MPDPRELTNTARAIQRAGVDLRQIGAEHSLDGQLLSIFMAKPNAAAALELLKNFQLRGGANSPVFPALQRSVIAQELFDRLLRPSAIEQGDAGLCGPASLLFELAGNQPYRYVKYAVDLFDTGRATLGNLEVKPNQSLRSAPKPTGVGSLDWLTMASLRNSENLPIFSYAEPGDLFSGITLPHEMENWLEALGYTNIENETDLLLPCNANEATLRKINTRFDAGARVFLFINANVLNPSTQNESSHTADHWIMLLSRINFMNKSSIHFTVYTWGNPFRQVPTPGGGKSLELSTFLGHFYGYVAGSL